MSVGQPLQDIALVDLPVFHEYASNQSKSSGPRHCVLLRAGGLLSLLDMELGVRLGQEHSIDILNARPTYYSFSIPSPQVRRNLQTLSHNSQKNLSCKLAFNHLILNDKLCQSPMHNCHKCGLRLRSGQARR